MSAPIQFSVDDTSPTINYQPFADTLSTPSLGLGWNPYYSVSGFSNAPGTVGQGQSFHVTSLNDASLTIHWHGTGIQLLGNVTDASFVILLDGHLNQSTSFDPSNNILATYQGLQNADHNITLQVVTPDIQDPPNSHTIFFDKALIIAASPQDTPSNTTFSQQPLNDLDIAYTGLWSIIEHGSDGSFHQTSTSGDRVQTTFNGTTFQLTGVSSPLSGRYSVTLDNVTTTLSATSSFTNYNTLLYYASGLSTQQTHSLEVVNEAGTLAVQVGGFLVDMSTNATTTPTADVTHSAHPTPISESSQSFPKGTIAALALAGVLSFVLFSLALFYCFVWKPRQRRLRRERRETLQMQKGFPGQRGATGLGAVVVDIGPEPVVLRQLGNGNGNGQQRQGSAISGNAGWIGVEIDTKRRESNRSSGFTRWKKDVEGGFGRDALKGLGLAFRPPDSSGQGYPRGTPTSRNDNYEYYEHHGRDSGTDDDDDDDSDKSPGLPKLTSLGLPYEGDKKGKGRSTQEPAAPEPGTHQKKTKSIRRTSSWTPSFTLDLSRFKSKAGSRSSGSPRYVHSRSGSQAEPFAGVSGIGAGRQTPGSPTSVPRSPNQTSLASSLSTFSYFSFISGRSHQAQQQRQQRQGSSLGSSGVQLDPNSKSNSQQSKPPSPSAAPADTKSSTPPDTNADVIKDMITKGHPAREGSTITSSSSLSPPRSVPRSAVSISDSSRGSLKSELSRIQIPEALIEIADLPPSLSRHHESRRTRDTSPIHPYAAAATAIRGSDGGQGRHARVGSSGPLLLGYGEVNPGTNEDEDLKSPYSPGAPDLGSGTAANRHSLAVPSVPVLAVDTSAKRTRADKTLSTISGRTEAIQSLSPRTMTAGFGGAQGSSVEGTSGHEPLPSSSAIPVATPAPTFIAGAGETAIVGGRSIRRLPQPPPVAAPSRPPLPRPPTATSTTSVEPAISGLPQTQPPAPSLAGLPQDSTLDALILGSTLDSRPAGDPPKYDPPKFLNVVESSPFSVEWRTLTEDTHPTTVELEASAAIEPTHGSGTAVPPPSYQRYPPTAPLSRTVSLSLPPRSVIPPRPSTSESTQSLPGPSRPAGPESPTTVSPSKKRVPGRSSFRLTPPSTAMLQGRSHHARHVTDPSDGSVVAGSSFLDFSGGGHGHVRGSLSTKSGTTGSAGGLSRAPSSTSTAYEREREAIAADHPDINRHSALTGMREVPPPVPPLPVDLLFSPMSMPSVPTSADTNPFPGLKSRWSVTTAGDAMSSGGEGSGIVSDSNSTAQAMESGQVTKKPTPEPASSEGEDATSQPNPTPATSSTNSPASSSQSTHSSGLHVHPPHLSISTSGSNPGQEDTLGMSFAGGSRAAQSGGSVLSPLNTALLSTKPHRVSTGTSMTNLTSNSNDAPGFSPTESLPLSDIRFGRSSTDFDAENDIPSDWGSRRSSNWLMMTGPGAGGLAPVTSSVEGLTGANTSRVNVPVASPSPVGGVRTQRPPLPFPSLGSSSSIPQQQLQQQYRHGSESSSSIPPRVDSTTPGGTSTPSYIVQRTLRPSISGPSGLSSATPIGTAAGEVFSQQQQESRPERSQQAHGRTSSNTFFGLLRGGNKDKETPS